VHVDVADEGAKGPQAGGVVGGAGLDMAVGGEALDALWPGASAGTREFGLEGGEGEDGAAAEGADAVEAFDFEEALALVVDDPAGGGVRADGDGCADQLDTPLGVDPVNWDIWGPRVSFSLTASACVSMFLNGFVNR